MLLFVAMMISTMRLITIVEKRNEIFDYILINQDDLENDFINQFIQEEA